MNDTPGYLRPFVVPAPERSALREGHVDLYLPDGDGPRPAVVLVHGGPLPPGLEVTPRDWPVFRGYGSLLASLGVVAATVDHGLGVVAGPDGLVADYPAAHELVESAVKAVRADARVDPDRVVLWFFSGGGLLSAVWLRERPEWLRGVALTYPLLAPVPRFAVDEWFRPAVAVGEPGGVVPPVVLTRVGLESPELAERVESFLVAAADAGVAVEVVDVPNGQHSFDVLDDAEESREAVRRVVARVVELLSA
ncbi:alpha/beta hydrolase [Longispora sp. K20-0274]|uniref:alpha/beta hydrolase family protein n=1 Tax=Longispora sp. K20-0274 TaxID=3088255 RepID=UPI00399C190C